MYNIYKSNMHMMSIYVTYIFQHFGSIIQFQYKQTSFSSKYPHIPILYTHSLIYKYKYIYIYIFISISSE